jgi:DNA replication protein DnaC
MNAEQRLAQKLEDFRRFVVNNPQQFLGGIGVPLLYREADVSDFESVPEVNAAGLYIVGPQGAGKTRLSAALLKRYLPKCAVLGEYNAREISARWITSQDLLLEIRRTMKDAEQEELVWQRYTGYELMVIDDLGAENRTEWSASILCQIISKRINGMHPTIITSNYTQDELAENVDARMAARCDAMNLHVFPAEAKDWRVAAR